MSLYKMLNKVECTEDGSLDLVIKGFVVFHPFEALPDRAGVSASGRRVIRDIKGLWFEYRSKYRLSPQYCRECEQICSYNSVTNTKNQSNQYAVSIFHLPNPDIRTFCHPELPGL